MRKKNLYIGTYNKGDDQEKFADFMSWVQNYNEYIINAYAEKSTSRNDKELDDLSIDDIVDIEMEEEVA